MLASTPKEIFLTKWYTQKVKDYATFILQNIDLTVNGFVYFMSSFILLICHHRQLPDGMFEQVTDRLLRMSLVCVITDHLLDNSKTSHLAKTQIQKALLRLAAKRDIDEKELLPEVGVAIKLVQSIVSEVPEIINLMCDTFRAEADSVRQQSSSGSSECLTMEQLRSIEHRKGRLTYQLFGALISNKVEVHMDLGYVIQICDDLIDMEADSKENISTVVHAGLSRDKCLDVVIYEALTLVKELPSNYWLYKMLCCYTLASIVSGYSNISKELKHIFQPYASCDVMPRGSHRKALYQHFEATVSKLDLK